MRRCEHHTSHRVGAVQGSDRAGRVGRFSIARFPACGIPGRWRIHHQEGGRLQPRRNQGAEVHQRNTQSTRLFHVCEAFSCRWHNYKPSRWNAPQRRLFRPCSRFVEQQAIQRHHGHGRRYLSDALEYLKAFTQKGEVKQQRGTRAHIHAIGN